MCYGSTKEARRVKGHFLEEGTPGLSPVGGSLPNLNGRKFDPSLEAGRACAKARRSVRIWCSWGRFCVAGP